MKCVASLVEQKSLCSGCGACMAACPTNSIKIVDRDGVYRPTLAEQCSQCGRCVKVCPFQGESSGDVAQNIYGHKNLKFDKTLGYYMGGYVGYSAEHRKRSASGGLGTWFLEKLLTENIVDCIACVSKRHDESKLYEYRLVSDIEELRNSSRSAYYPVEMSEILSQIKNSGKRCAVIGVPCFIRGVRKLQNVDKSFAEAIVVTAGICCNSLPNKKIVEFMAELAGEKRNVKEITFRYKDNNIMKNHCTVLKFEDKTIKSFSHQDSIFSFPYYQRLFAQESCSCCDDVFAECADVVFMDAWLEKYSHSTEGFTIALTRSEIADKLFRETLGEEIQTLEAELVLKSQANVGVVQYKRNFIGGRVAYYHEQGYKMPDIRCAKLDKLTSRSYKLKERYDTGNRKLVAEYMKKPMVEREDIFAIKKKIQKKQKKAHIYGAIYRKIAQILKKCGIKL